MPRILQARKPCIRQNVCTSLRTVDDHAGRQIALTLHTSKRMHFIEEVCGLPSTPTCRRLAYVKTYALH